MTECRRKVPSYESELTNNTTAEKHRSRTEDITLIGPPVFKDSDRYEFREQLLSTEGSIPSFRNYRVILRSRRSDRGPLWWQALAVAARGSRKRAANTRGQADED